MPYGFEPGVIDRHKLQLLRPRIGRAQRIVNSVSPHLEADEQVISAFPATTVSSLWFILPSVFACQFVVRVLDGPGWATLLGVAVCLVVLIAAVAWKSPNRLVVATERRTILGKASWFNTSKFTAIEREFAVDHRVGPTTGFFWLKSRSLGQKLHIHMMFADAVLAADRRQAATTVS